MSTTKRVSFIRRYADVGVLEIPMGVNVIINDGPCTHLDKAYSISALPEDGEVTWPITETTELVLDVSTFGYYITAQVEDGLEGYRCPVCMHTGPFTVYPKTAWGMAGDGTLSAIDETDDPEGVEHNTPCTCPQCGMYTTSASFDVTTWSRLQGGVL